MVNPALWDELVRLGVRAVVPIESRYVPTGDAVTFSLSALTIADLDDLLYVQTELSAQLLAREAAGSRSGLRELAHAALTGIGSTAPAARRLS